MWDDFDTRVTKICKEFDLQKQELAEQLGLPKGRLSQLKGYASHSVAYRILLTYPQISARWLLFGEGDMLEAKQVQQHQEMAIVTPAPQQNSPEYNRLLSAYTEVVAENALLKDRLKEKTSRGLASA